MVMAVPGCLDKFIVEMLSAVGKDRIVQIIDLLLDK